MSQTYVFARNAPDAEYDRSLAWAALILAAAGLVMVYSASIATAEASRFTGHNSAWYLARHAVYLGAAFFAALLVFLVPARLWQKAAPWPELERHLAEAERQALERLGRLREEDLRRLGKRGPVELVTAQQLIERSVIDHIREHAEEVRRIRRSLGQRA